MGRRISNHCASRLITVWWQLKLYKSAYTVNQGTDMSFYAALFAFANFNNKDLTSFGVAEGKLL